MKFILKYLKDNPPDTALPIAIGHSNTALGCNNLMDFLKPHLPIKDIVIGKIGAVIGTYIGPGAFGIIYFEKD